MTKSERGILSEWQVVCDRLHHHHEALVVHRKRTPYAEVDLLFVAQTRPSASKSQWQGSSQPTLMKGSSCVLTMIEVKTIASGEIWGESLISRAQLGRLKRARLHLQIQYRWPVRFLIAVVQMPKRGQFKISYFQVPGGMDS